MKAIHFENQEDRIRFVKGAYKEIVPEKAKPKKKKRKKKNEVPAE